MLKLNTIQKRENLNMVCRCGGPGPGGGYHDYAIVSETSKAILAEIKFQKGPRNDPNSRHGALDQDLLEIVRDRLKSFQKGDYATRETALAITCIEEALLWLNKRTEDRIERNVLGTMEK